MNKIHIDDYGTRFTVTVKDADDSVFSLVGLSVDFWFCKPDGSVIVKTASYTTDGTDGKAYYTTASGDIDSLGIWRLQAKVYGGSSNFFTNSARFRVINNLNEE